MQEKKRIFIGTRLITDRMGSSQMDEKGLSEPFYPEFEMPNRISGD